MLSYIIIAIIAALIIGRLIKGKHSFKRTTTMPITNNIKPMSEWQKKIFTVAVFTKISTKRFFRDKLALFFGILFPLIFLIVFGALSNTGNVSFNVALINQSKSSYAKYVVANIKNDKTYKIDETVKTLAQAKAKMDKNQLDAALVIPPSFGQIQPGQHQPTGKLVVVYNVSQQSAGQTLTSLLPNNLKFINARFVPVNMPFTVEGKQLVKKTLTSFDYTFAGLLGFTVIGIGIFGPVNVFPELKKQGILRRLHTTPIKVWQYFLSTMFSQAITGSVAVAVQFAVAITVFHLNVDGNYFDILIYLILSIFMILGIGLAIGGWAKNERQAAPLANIVVFPMLFLSGTFFPRYLMPSWLQSVTNYLPLTPVIDGLRMLTTEGKTLINIGPQLGLVAIWLVIIYAIAFRVFKWE